MYLYVIKQIDIIEKTQKDLERDFQIMNIEWGKISYEKYLASLDFWSERKYYYKPYTEGDCYFKSLEEAKEYAESGAIYENGETNYLALIEIPFNSIYAITNIKSIHIFEYEKDIYKYVEVPLSHNNKTELIVKRHYLSYMLN